MWSNTRVQTLLDVEDLGYEKTKHPEALEVVGMRVADYVFAARPMLGQFCLHTGSELKSM